MSSPDKLFPLEMKRVRGLPNYQGMTQKEKIERQINILSKMKRENINF